MRWLSGKGACCQVPGRLHSHSLVLTFNCPLTSTVYLWRMKTHKYVNHEKEKALYKYSQKATHTSQKIETIKMPINQQMVNTMGKKMSQESGAYLQHYLVRDRQISGGQPGLHSIFQDSQGYTMRSFLNKIKQSNSKS